MIRINLLGQESARDNTGVLQIAAFAVSLVLLIGVFFLLNGSLVDENNLLTQEKESLELKLEGVKKRTKEVRDLEKKRTRLKEKLVVIARLKKSKTGPVRVLDDLNNALPEKAWISSAKENSGYLSIIGLALDHITIADFIRELEKSDYFKTVELVEARGADFKGVGMQRFALNANISYVGKIEQKAVEGEEGSQDKKKKKVALLDGRDLTKG